MMATEAERQAARAAVQAWDMENGSLLLPDEHAVIANRALEAAEKVREPYEFARKIVEGSKRRVLLRLLTRAAQISAHRAAE
jgi:hypothetical protein